MVFTYIAALKRRLTMRTNSVSIRDIPVIRRRAAGRRTPPARLRGTFAEFRTGANSLSEIQGSTFSEPMTKFLVTATAILAVTLAIFVYPLHRASMPQVIDAAIEAFTGAGHSGLNSKDQFLAQLSAERKKDYSRQVHYVLEIIKSTKKDPVEAKKLAISIVTESFRANYDPLFVASVVRSESTFNRHAHSYAGAKGLMQILPGTGKYISAKNQIDWHGELKLNDPSYNLQLGIAYLKELEKKFEGNRERMLIAYNWGPGNLWKALKGEKRIPGSSMEYAKGIISRHNQWKKELALKGATYQYLDVEFIA